MLRQLSIITRVLRGHLPGARERLAYRMLQALVVEPEPRVIRARVTERDGIRRRDV